jgi:hypothetical protein
VVALAGCRDEPRKMGAVSFIGPNAPPYQVQCTGTADDRLIQSAISATPQRPITILPGTCAVTSPLNLVSGARLHLSSGTVLNSTLTPSTPNSPAVFAGSYAPNPPSVTGSTTLSTSPTYGASTLAFTSTTGFTTCAAPATGATCPAGSLILVQDAVRGIPYVIRSITATDAGPSSGTVTVDRPVLWPFTGTITVYQLTSILQDVEITGDKGAIVQGTGADGGEVVACWRCKVRGIRWLSSFKYKVFSFDWGGLDDTFEDNEVELVSASGGTPAGLMLEDAENGVMHHNVARGGFSGSFLLDSTRQSSTRANTAIGAVYGFIDEADVSDTLGCLDTTHVGDSALNASGVGMNLLSPGDRTKVIGFSSYGSAVGMETAHTNTEVESFSSVGASTAGLATNGVGIRARGIYASNVGGAIGISLSGGDSLLEHVATTGEPAIEVVASSTTTTIDGWRHTFGAVNGQSLAYSDGGSLSSLRTTCRDCTFTYVSSTGNKVAFQFTSATTFSGERIRWVGSNANGYVLYDPANASTISYVGAWEVSPASNFLLGTPVGQSRGTVTVNGATAVDVAFAPIQSTSLVTLTRMTAGGTPCTVGPTFTITGGTKFSVKGNTTSCNDVLAYEIKP